MKIFLGSLAHRSLNTYDLLQIKCAHWVVPPSVCFMCRQNTESIYDHLFIHCSFSFVVWQWVLGVFNFSLCLPNIIDEWLIEALLGWNMRNRHLWTLFVVILRTVVFEELQFFCNYSLSMVQSNWRALLQCFVGKLLSSPLPLGFSLALCIIYIKFLFLTPSPHPNEKQSTFKDFLLLMTDHFQHGHGENYHFAFFFFFFFCRFTGKKHLEGLLLEY